MRNYKDATEVILVAITLVSLLFVALTTDVNYKFSDFQAAVSVREDNISGVQVKNRSHDFGHVYMAEGELKYIFPLKNISKKDLVIDKAYSSSQALRMFLTVDGEKYGPYGLRDYLYSSTKNIMIGPDKMFYVEALFDPSLQGPFGVGLTGPFITIENDQGEKLTLRISAVVLP